MALDDQGINWSEFFNAYSGIRFTIQKDGCDIFVPTYANVTHSTTERTSSGEMLSLPVSGTDMTFQDSWSSNAFLVSGEPTRLNKVFIKDLWEYPENNVSWDEFNEILSFEDITVEKTNLKDFVSDLDTFLIFNKLNKFGDVWWVGRIKADIQSNESQYSNVIVTNVSGNDILPTNTIEFWSPDKHINDEYKRYLSSPTTYSGFLTSTDFENGGWFSIPHMRISTKPFEKLKFAEALLNLNFTLDPKTNFGSYYSIDSTIGGRLKDSTSGVVFDSSQSGGTQNNRSYSDILISHWVGGLIDSDNISTLGAIGNFQENACTQKQNEINYIEEDVVGDNAISHAIDAQITLKSDYSSDKRDFLGTIDPINWISVESEQSENIHSVGALNVDRAFGGANGNINAGLVVGGIKTTEEGLTDVLESAEIWNGETFLKNAIVDLNAPRCFHIQGGSGSGSCAVVGGYGAMNNTDVDQFSRYGKTTVRSSMEYYVNSNDGGSLSYFRTISDYTMNVPRGEAAGTIDVVTNTRQDKFEVEQLIKNYNITENDEQKILEFVNDSSLDNLNNYPVPANFRRYNVANINGFIYGGNKTGDVFLTDTPSNGEIIDTFETINTTHVDVSKNIDTSSDSLSVSDTIGTPTEVIRNVITVFGEDDVGEEIILEKAGKYRLEYINGSYLFKFGEFDDENETYEVIGNDTDGTQFIAPTPGSYSFEIISGAVWHETGFLQYAYNSAIQIRVNGGSWQTLISGIDSQDPTVAFNSVAGIKASYCVTSAPATIDIRFPDPGLWSFLLRRGTMNVRVTYDGTDCVDVSGAGFYGSNTSVYLNDQNIGSAFNSGALVTRKEVELEVSADPLLNSFDFCVEQPESTINLRSNDILNGDYTDNGGSVNMRLLYIGESDCDIWELNTSQASLVETGLSIIYSSSDPLRAYPVRCHGAVYVGDNNGGLSTGGRTEYNDISDIECRLREKYNLTAKNSCSNNSLSSNTLESDRVLDLVYEYSGDTWIRKQNMFESVYYHTGVGNNINAIFWGGIHDTINDFEYDFNVNTVSVSGVPISAFACETDRNTITSNIETFGVVYKHISDIENSDCWSTPTWTTSLSGSLTNDPLYNPGQATLSHLTGSNYSTVTVTSTYPNNPIIVSSQLGIISEDVPSLNQLDLTVTYPTSAEFKGSFGVISYVKNEDNTLSSSSIPGTFIIDEVNELSIINTDNDLYPASVSPASSGWSLNFQFTSIEVIENGTVQLYYSVDNRDGDFRLRGYGILQFNSMQEIWESIINDTSIDATSNIFTIQENSEYEYTITDDVIGTATITFTILPENTTFIGVKNSDITWQSQSSVCGPDLTQFISLNAAFKPSNNLRWGTPLWVGEFVKNNGNILNISYEYTTSELETKLKHGTNEFEVSEITIDTIDIASVLNGRSIIHGDTLNQFHEYTAINNTTFSPSATTTCENITASATSAISAANMSGSGYGEWATSIVQEYRSDERFSTPQDFIPSNYYDIRGNNTLLTFKPSKWKRFMDGVGLGGDTPDYSTIVDKDGNKLNVSEWKNIGTWNIGQMAFGEPTQAIIVGGHKVDPLQNKIGIHAHQTTKRLFKWDMQSIPPEDTYLRNYIGRRLWTYYIDKNGVLQPTRAKSSIGLTIFNAESIIDVERHGSITVENNNNIQVNFTEPMPDDVGDNYSISLTPSDNINVWWTNKSSTGFTVNVETEFWSGTIDYSATAEIKVQQKDLDDLDDLDGYIFNK